MCNVFRPLPLKRQMCTTLRATAFLLAASIVAGQTTTDGAISGRIVDTQGGAVPGARITISGNDPPRELFTDANGEFQVDRLALGSYQVAAELPGFRPTSGRIVLTPNTRRAHVTWPLQIGCLSEVAWVTRPARAVLPAANRIVRLRIRSDEGRVQLSSRPDCDGFVEHAYAVDVVTAVSIRPSANEPATGPEVLLSGRGTMPLTPGQECLVVLFAPRMRVGGGLILPITSGRISSSDEAELNGKTVDEVIGILIGWSRESVP